MAARGKIGVLTFHKCINYGSYWQARCLVEGLQQRGFDAELLDHDSPGVRMAEARCALQPKLPERAARAEIDGYKTKTRKFARAIAELPQSKRFPLNEPEAAGAYDAIVVGSDEVWNFSHPWYRGQPIFFGERLKTTRLISYAASFGNHSCHWGMDQHWAEQLKRFDGLSVRDQNSFWLVRGSTGVTPTVVLDPCLQFPGIAKGEPSNAAPYALVYGYAFPAWLAQRVRSWAAAAGVRLVSVGYTNLWADEQQVAVGPVEFAQLMSGARAVVTNFFHGCVFALLNGKPWVTAPSDYRAIKIPDLAAKLRAEHHVVDKEVSQSGVDALLNMPLQAQVTQSIGDYRARSDEYLNAALA